MIFLLSILMLLAGLFLVFLEFFLPGAILGILGSLLVIASVVVFATVAVALWMVFVYIVIVIVLSIILVRYALWKIRSAPKGESIYLNSDQEGYVASEYPKELLGKKGHALTDLKPSGHAMIEGQRWQATSTGAYIEKGAEVEVIGGEGGHLIVKKVHTQQGNEP